MSEIAFGIVAPKVIPAPSQGWPMIRGFYGAEGQGALCARRIKHDHLPVLGAVFPALQRTRCDISSRLKPTTHALGSRTAVFHRLGQSLGSPAAMPCRTAHLRRAEKGLKNGQCG